MAMSPLAGGLLNVVAGQGKAAEQRMDTASKEDSARRMIQMEMEMRDEYAQRVAERTRNQNMSDLKTIESQAQSGLATKELRQFGGGELSAEDVQTLRDNPEAVAAYRKAGATGLLNYSRQDEAEAKANAALSIGRTDYADKYEQTARGERADAKEERRHQETLQRMDIQLGQAAAAARRAAASEENAQNRARMSGLNAAAENETEKAKELLRLAKDSMDDAERASLIAEAKGHQDKASKYYEQSIKISGIELPKAESTDGNGVVDYTNYAPNAVAEPAQEQPKPSSQPKPAQPPATAKDRFMALSSSARSAIQKQYENAGGRQTGKDLYSWWAST